MPASAVYIVDLKGKPLISRDYRGDVDMNIIDKFLPLVMDSEEEGLMSPILFHEKVTFIYVKHRNLYCIHPPLPLPPSLPLSLPPSSLFLPLPFSLPLSSLSHSQFVSLIACLVVATTIKNANVAVIFSFLHRIVEVFQEYFKEMEEESVRDNFVIIYELMDELMDFGYPQTTESKILKE
jgi:AP-1 complex subunit mu